MAELGWVGIPFPEAYGGAGMGLAELAVVLEALGRRLAPEPFLSSVLLGGQAILRAGSDAQRDAWLPRLVAGDALLALANQERGSRFELAARRHAARREGDGVRPAAARRSRCSTAPRADALVVAARTAGDAADAAGISLFLVPADTPGVQVVRQWRVDSRNAASRALADARVPADALLGRAGRGPRRARGRWSTSPPPALCAEMLGSMSEAFERTLALPEEPRAVRRADRHASRR